MCDYDFDDELWETVSDQAKDFITHLLQIKPEERYDVNMALKHSWILESKAILLERCLINTLPRMRKNHMDRLGASMHGIPVTKPLMKKDFLGRSMHDTRIRERSMLPSS